MGRPCLAHALAQAFTLLLAVCPAVDVIALHLKCACHPSHFLDTKLYTQTVLQNSTQTLHRVVFLKDSTQTLQHVDFSTKLYTNSTSCRLFYETLHKLYIL